MDKQLADKIISLEAVNILAIVLLVVAGITAYCIFKYVNSKFGPPQIKCIYSGDVEDIKCDVSDLTKRLEELHVKVSLFNSNDPVEIKGVLSSIEKNIITLIRIIVLLVEKFGGEHVFELTKAILDSRNDSPRN